MGRWGAAGAYLSGIGWFLATAIGLGALLGHWIDSKSGIEPTFTLVGLGLGLAIGLVGGFRMLMAFLRRFGGDAT